jgi:hypothetical protein
MDPRSDFILTPDQQDTMFDAMVNLSNLLLALPDSGLIAALAEFKRITGVMKAAERVAYPDSVVEAVA